MRRAVFTRDMQIAKNKSLQQAQNLSGRVPGDPL